ncbi:MAG: FHA domain-containing protein [Chloroflexi bacterium]|nr:FHA domain-containing protein [Chloroflexota bacterium]MCH8348974.1 FHA domain-containing protein [Chloroflexota bacterium]MCI0780505.1 FHA domain-containing protein [Chloroflexota bacterium]MCI0786368.1 FHA domain-containing protein [Chloroflexota bacterium]MCI0798371.1 FHA domain-containing protein [Chloroflexota bacterium]
MEANQEPLGIGPNAILVIESTVIGGGQFPLKEGGRYFVGRSPACDIVIDLPIISRKHAQIMYHDNAFFVSDLESRNGTYVNAKRLQGDEEVSLSHGDWIGFANDQVILHYHESGGSTTLGMDRTAVHGDLRLDTSTGQVWVKGNQLSPPLSQGEFDLLNILYGKRGIAVGEDELAAALFSGSGDEDDATGEIGRRVRQLRLKMELNPSAPQLLVTLPGYGYILVGPPTSEDGD